MLVEEEKNGVERMVFLPGKRIASLLPGPLLEDQVQPAGVDLRVGSVSRIVEAGFLGRSRKRIPRAEPIASQEGVWRLGPGHYRIRFLDTVSVPRWAVGFCYPRSSLLRMGATLLCAVWDPGYTGRGEALLVVYNGLGIELEEEARIAQLVFARLEEEVEAYSGDYQGEGL